ncbi:MAG: murein biosynthesis integral membrane protein MurJ [Chitinispirillaceae bacterium]|nr:murein biosynthesis integral membrane protein MurJ [Chitinispirillaceae bacterium]
MNTETAAEKKSLKKTLTFATVIMMGSVLLSRIVGLVREQVIAGFGGTGADIDSYVTAFFIPELLNHFLAEGFLSITFIPIFLRYWADGDREGAWRSYSNLFSIGSVVFCIAIPLAMLFTPSILCLMGPHIANENTLVMTVKLTRIILPAQLFFYWGAFFSAVQMAQQRFFVPALAPFFYNAGIIVGGIVLGPRIGIEGFAWGVLGGAFIANVLVQLPGAMRAGMRYRICFNPRHKDFRTFVMLSLPLVFGLGMTFSNEIFFRFFGSFLQEGATASLNYSLRTMGIMIALFGQAWGVAFYPHLTRLAAEKKMKEISLLLNRTLMRIGTYSIPIATLCIVCSSEIISILYEHGRFDSGSTARTAPLFALYMVGSFFFAAAVFTARPFYAVQKTLPPMIASTTVSLMILPVYYISSKVCGAPGIAGSAVAGMALQFFFVYFLWHRNYGEGQSIRLLKRIALVVAISLVAGLVGMLVKQSIQSLDTGWGVKVDSALVALAASLPFAVIVLASYHLTGLQKAGELLDVIRKRT